MLRTALLAAALTLGLTTTASAEVITFKAKLTAAKEVPAKDSKGMGEAEAQLDTTTKTLTWTVTWRDLTGAPTMAHFHGPAAPGANAGVIVPLGMNPTSPDTGTAQLTDEQIQDFKDGKVYVNVHTAANPGGEIRGQMTAVKEHKH
jgi:hypothetical protein